MNPEMYSEIEKRNLFSHERRSPSSKMAKIYQDLLANLLSKIKAEKECQVWSLTRSWHFVRNKSSQNNVSSLQTCHLICTCAAWTTCTCKSSAGARLSVCGGGGHLCELETVGRSLVCSQLPASTGLPIQLISPSYPELFQAVLSLVETRFCPSRGIPFKVKIRDWTWTAGEKPPIFTSGTFCNKAQLYL